MTLCLAMLVLNEARGIRRTLESVRDDIDAWCVIDTGSTDGTPGLVHDALEGIPGALVHEPFVDFATTRNRALDLAHEYEGCDWTLMLSGDAFVEHPERLVETMRAADETGADVVELPIRYGGLDYFQATMARGGSAARYEGVTHELLDGAARYRATNGPIIHYEPPADEDRTARWQRDLALLSAEHERRPEHARTAYYLGQTLECLHLYQAAADVYATRMALRTGNDDERYVAALRRARCLWRLDAPTRDVLAAFAMAELLAPERAETFYDRAKYGRTHGDRRRAERDARIAAALPYPTRGMFIERPVYEGGAARLAAEIAADIRRTTPH